MEKTPTTKMKKLITSILFAAILSIAVPTFAQTRYYSERRARAATTRYYNQHQYYGSNYGQPNAYDRHRKALNLAIGTGAGALIGALLGGKKGALIGAGAGLAGGAIVTAKQSPRNYYRYY
jgi:hypothetical protein